MRSGAGRLLALDQLRSETQLFWGGGAESCGLRALTGGGAGTEATGGDLGSAGGTSGGGASVLVIPNSSQSGTRPVCWDEMLEQPATTRASEPIETKINFDTLILCGSCGTTQALFPACVSREGE